MNLTQHAPRSPRVRLGGYVILPRMLDKGRATIAGTNGEYHYNCPLDDHFIKFAGINPDALLEQLKAGKGDGEILAWITANATNKHNELEIKAWSAWQESRVPSSVETREYMHEAQKKIAPAREDIGAWFDLLDVDDYVTFGGKA
jgi:Domain of unknown function (DUF5069)